MAVSDTFLGDAEAIHRRAMATLFEELNSLCEGAIAVDKNARVVWINEKYVHTLGLRSADEALGREIEELIPKSLMRQVVQTGNPILLDIMEFGDQSFVVTRMPLFDDARHVIGAVGFVLFDRLRYLKPLVDKFGRLQQQLADMQRRLTEARRAKYTFDDLRGDSAPVQQLKRQAHRAAQLDATVLLLGETGTGKELLAHAIHAGSARADKPLIVVNMAAVPETLMEAEFFGAAPGAYTGADRRGREGKFKLADGGTLFLDEVGDMPLALQGKLLRVLQEQEIEPLGSNKLTKVDVRVIAATSVDLKKLVAEGRFRSDLYFRLNVLPIRVPALRERLGDLKQLAESILDQIAERSGLAKRELAPSAIEALARYDWPGNVRELRNVLEQILLLSDNLRISADDVMEILPIGARRAAVDAVAAQVEATTYEQAFNEFETNLFKAALEAHGGKVDAVAKSLGLARATLYKKLARLHLIQPHHRYERLVS
jgi:transcriptional regulator with PAS, ATPase and Fis domain